MSYCYDPRNDAFSCWGLLTLQHEGKKGRRFNYILLIIFTFQLEMEPEVFASQAELNIGVFGPLLPDM